MPGVGPAIAQRIIDSRPYSCIDDLLKVKGIGAVTLGKIKEQGLAHVSNPEEKLEVQVNILSEIFPDKISFVEIMPSPEGDDAKGEYIRIENGNDFEVDLRGWKVEDIAGAKKTHTLKEVLPPSEFLTLYRAETGITLNNSADGLNLTDPAGEIKDSVIFENAKAGLKYIRTPSGWKWSDHPPKKQLLDIKPFPANISAASPEMLIESREIDLSSPENPATPLIAISLFVSSLSAGIFLYLKKKIS